MAINFRINNLAPKVLTIFFFAFDTMSIVKALVLLFFMLVTSGKRIFTYFDINSIVLQAFLIIYIILSSFGADQNATANLQLLVLPITLYASGKWLESKIKSPEELLIILYLIGFSLAWLAIVAVLKEVSQFGFIGGSRSISLGEGRVESSATALAGSLVILLGLAGSIFASFNRHPIFIRVIILGSLAIAIATALRLGSRTSLALAILSILIGLLLNI
jgi:hypothetical protein